jgi:MoaA/NifB/PqqE/SkfB family radical SAM enzyme
MQIGFAITQHCNLRCPHCIRDDITTVRSLSVEFMARVIDEARAALGEFSISMTGGEPLIHPEWSQIIEMLRVRGISYRFVSNGWHMKRALPSLEAHPPEFVRLSLSGANPEVHDEERGRGSFNRVLLATALLTSRRIPTSYSFIVDRRTVHQITDAAGLAEAIGAIDIHFILPQPTPGSAARNSDISPSDWVPVRRKIEALANIPYRKTRVLIDYGVPFDGEEQMCQTMQMQRITVDASGRMATCCQMSDYGGNETEVVADLNVESFGVAFEKYMMRMAALRAATRPNADSEWPLEKFPCMRCARAGGKLKWLANYPQSDWSEPASGKRALRVLGLIPA